MTLSCYRYGMVLRQTQPDGAVSEYAVDPAQVGTLLSAQVTLDTGLLSPEVLLVRRTGARELRLHYRAAQRTGLWLEGSAEPLRVPLPPLLWALTHTDGGGWQAQVWAVKARPKTLDVPLFHAPLPNVFHAGSICWGNLRLDPQADAATLMALFWGSPFGNHAVHNKSRAYPQDIRQQLLALEGARSYPRRDLIPTGRTLSAQLEKLT